MNRVIGRKDSGTQQRVRDDTKTVSERSGKTIPVYFQPKYNHILVRLNAYARANDISRGEVIIRAIHELLEKLNAP